MNTATAKGGAALYAQVTRANGKVERRRLVAYYHPNPLRRFLVRALMRMGVV
jgi:hypothetical protein